MTTMMDKPLTTDDVDEVTPLAFPPEHFTAPAETAASAVFAVVPGNAGHALDEAPLPYWLDKPCPAWCQGLSHKDYHPYGERLHMSAVQTVVLTLEEPHHVEEEDGWSDACIDVDMWQHYRHRDPHLSLTIDYGEEPHLTTGEAAKLANVLEALIIAGHRVAESVAATPYCPAWCTTAHSHGGAPKDRSHVGEYQWVTLTMVDPEVRWARPDGEEPTDVQPASIGVRLEQGERETEARVVIVYRDKYTDLTLTEGAALSDLLMDLTAQAASGGVTAGYEPTNISLDEFPLETEGAPPEILVTLASRLTLDEAAEAAAALTELVSRGRARLAHNEGFNKGYAYALAGAANQLEWGMRDGKSPQEVIDCLRSEAQETDPEGEEDASQLISAAPSELAAGGHRL